MAGSVFMQQVKVTCKKEAFGVIESIDKKQRNKLSKLVDRYIYTVEILFSENVSMGGDAVEQWKIDHPNIIGKNVAKNIKNCVKHNYNCYLRSIYDDEFAFTFCSDKFTNNGEYEIVATDIHLHVNSNNEVTFSTGY